MNETNNSALVMVEGSMAMELVGKTNASFCSFVPQNETEKSILFNLMNAPEFRLADFINTEIYVTDVFCETVQCVSKETGEQVEVPRIVLIDSDNNGYQCVSMGVFSSLKKLFAVKGTPDSWQSPVRIVVKQITKGERKLLSLQLAV